MYYKLKERFLLRGWEKLPYAIVDKKTGDATFINKEAIDVLDLCNGKIDLSLPMIPAKIRDLIPETEKLGLIEPCEQGSEINEEQKYHMYPARYIETAHWSITGKCNYKCKHCYMSAPDAKLGELSHETIMSIIDQLAECGIMHVTITGGEPLIRKDFMEIVDALLERGIHINTIYSNGKLVTDKLLDQLAERGIHPEFNMSFDGVGHHDWLRGIPGAEKYVEEAFLRCKEKGFPTGAEMCIHQDNKHTLRESINKLASWGCGHLKTNPISNVGAWKEGGYGESISIKDVFQLYLDYIPQYYEDGMPLSLQLGGFFIASPRRPKEYRVASEKYCDDPNTMCICGHARRVMYIAADGHTLPCMALSGMDIQEEFPMITEIGLAKCITDSRYMRLIDTRAAEFFEMNPECKACEYAMSCVGGCRAAALEYDPDNILGIDRSTCEIFKGGWAPRVKEAAKAAVEKYVTGDSAEKTSE